MNFLKRLWRKFFTKKAPPKYLDYDTTQLVDEDGHDLGISEEANKARKQILQTKLGEGDSYRLGPEATVHVGPEGLAGKKSDIAARIAASEARRKAKFDKWWAEKRERCIKIMMMSEEELEAAGITAAVEAWIAENNHMIEMAEKQGLFKRKPRAVATLFEAPAPSGNATVRTSEAFEKIMTDAKLAETDAVVTVGERKN